MRSSFEKECRGGAVIRLIITDMNETYPEDLEEILRREGLDDACVRLSMKDVEGRNMYCDDAAYGIIRDRLSEIPDTETGIHLIDTGNYHYMSRIFTSFVDECYDLLLIDHHTDMQEASFGGLLSCGSWAREVLEKDVNIRTLTLIGPEKFEEGGEEILLNVGGRNLSGRIYHGAHHADGNVPLYISVDKDVMSTSECITNWDQGDLSLSGLGEVLTELAEGRRIIGADICGGLSENDPGYDAGARTKNTASDIGLIRLLKNIAEN